MLSATCNLYLRPFFLYRGLGISRGLLECSLLYCSVHEHATTDWRQKLLNALQVAFWACATSIVVVGLAIMLIIMAFARHKRLLFIPKAHLAP